MAHDLTRLIHRGGTRSAVRADVIRLAPDPAILDTMIALRLGKAAPRRRPWISERDALDAAMAFALTFCGATVFLL